MKFVSLALLGLFVVGCDKKDNSTPTPPPTNPVVVDVAPVPTAVELTETSNNASVSVGDGGEVAVTLTEDTTKNLKWVSVGNDQTILKLKDESKKTPTPDKEARRFVFSTAAKGTVKLTFDYGPYTHEQDQAVNTVVFNITVK